MRLIAQVLSPFSIQHSLHNVELQLLNQAFVA
jgi:hypothetical protein